MIALLLAGLLAAASAAPYYHQHHHHGHRPHRYSDMDDFSMNDNIFDTARFWQQLETDMLEMEKMLNSFHTRFTLVSASAGIDGNEYKVTLPLSGFDEKDIVVKAREGVLMVQAVHKSADGSERNYIDIRSLPSIVDTAGIWTYTDEVLTIKFPLKSVSTESTVTEEIATVGSISHEEIDVRGSEGFEDADVGIKNEAGKEAEIQTNEIPKREVEATTYAVDLKDQYEFVPVHYKK